MHVAVSSTVATDSVTTRYNGQSITIDRDEHASPEACVATTVISALVDSEDEHDIDLRVTGPVDREALDRLVSAIPGTKVSLCLRGADE